MSQLFQERVASQGSRLFLTLAIGSTAFMLFALGLTRLMRRHSASTRFLVWQLAFVGVLLIPLTQALVPIQDDEFTGKIVGEEGNPIKNASIRIEIFEEEEGAGGDGLASRLKELATTTDKTGEYRVNLAEFSALGKSLVVGVWASSDKCWERHKYFRPREFRETGEFPAIELRVGRRLVGRISVAGDSDEIQLNAGKVMLFGLSLDRNDGATIWYDSFTKEIETVMDDRFECIVPADCSLFIAATADGYAIARHTIDETETDAGDIELARGTVVKGILRNRGGKPMPNAVVQLTENELYFSPLDSVYQIRSAAKTDSEGRFQFPAHNGKCTILVGLSGASTFGPSHFPDSDRQPLVVPVTLDLDSGNRTDEIELQEAAPRYISGKVLLDDGWPAGEVVVEASIMAGGMSIRISRTLTNKMDGTWTIAVPAELSWFCIKVNGRRNEMGEMLFALPEDHPRAKGSSTKKIWFENVEGDVTDVNWVLRPNNQE